MPAAKQKTRSAATAKKKPAKHQHPPTGHARNYAQIAHDYASEAAADRAGKTFCKWVRLAAKRHLDDLKKKRWPYYFDEWHANDICDFAEKMPHIEGAWDTATITLEPAQIFILVVVFGWRRHSDQKRRFGRVYIEVARKNAKSTLTAVVALYCLACEGEVGPQIIIGASTGEQANKVFTPAQRMTQKTPEFCEAFGVVPWARSITCSGSGGYIQTINSKSSTQDGHNPHVGILDELHAHKNRGLFDVIRSAFGARKNPLMWMITTAGYDVMGVCYEQRTLVTKVLEKVIEAEHLFGIIFTLDEKDDPLDERAWVKANPLLGSAVQLDELRGFAAEAVASPDMMGEFRTKRLNIWTTSRGGWISRPQWKRCGGAVDLAQLAAAGVPCWGGLDLASTSDITAFVLVWLLDDRLKVWGRYYLPEDTVYPRTVQGNLPYQQWAGEGHLIVTPGNVTDYDYVQDDISAALSRFNVQQIGFDRWNSSQVVNNLTADDAPMIELPQNTKTYHPAMKDLERRLKKRTLDHGNDPVLAWMASNLVAIRDSNDNLKPDKKKSMEKIDGMVAMLMAMSLALLTPVENSVEVYI